MKKLLLIALLTVLAISCQKAFDVQKFGQVQEPSVVVLHSPIIRLLDKNGRFFCSGVVFDSQYAATAGHCLVDPFFGALRKEPIIVEDVNGNSTEATAIPFAAVPRVDYGIIKGDFRNFKVAKIESVNNVFEDGGPFITCGFAMGQKKLTCNSFTPKGQTYFAVVGRGYLVPGMSGGPVIDLSTGSVVAVNSAVGEEGVIVTPLLGIMGLLEFFK